MGEPHVVKARVHHGSESLDLTVPVDLKRKLGVSSGDVFVVEGDEEDGELTITYKRIHQS